MNRQNLKRVTRNRSLQAREMKDRIRAGIGHLSLVSQWRQLMEWKATGFQGLDRDACMPQWADIMREVEKRAQGMDVTKLDPTRTASDYMEAATICRTRIL
jgi:hypothetical protein